LVDSLSVVFSWNRAENDVVYEIICTSRRVEPNEGDYDGSEDAIFQGFNATFGNVILDPSLSELPPNFEYNPRAENAGLRWIPGCFRTGFIISA